MNRDLVYVVDDDADLAGSVVRLMERNGHRAEAFIDPRLLLETYCYERADCVVTDIMMGDFDGFAFARRLKEIDPSSSVISMTAWSRVANAVDTVRTRAGIDYVEKPIDEERLLLSVEAAVETSRMRRKTQSRLSTLSKRELMFSRYLSKGIKIKSSHPA